MIWESSYWKEPLLESASWLRRVRFRKNTRERTLARVEKEIFIGFYSIRKPLEAIKVSDNTKNSKHELTWYSNTKTANYLNWHKIEDLYNLSSTNKETRDLEYVCNLFIHSYIFSLAGEERLEGVYINSENTKNKKLYFISLNTILVIFRLVGRDYPANQSFSRNPETNELTAHAW